MKIDVIIPTYNRAHVLSRAIESVLTQGYQDYLLHIVDDGSSDETALLLKKYSEDPRIKIYYQKNSGVSAARNLAAFKSGGDWISFLDSDDEWLPNKLATQVDFIQKNPGYRFLHTEEIWVRNGKRVNPKLKHQKTNVELLTRSLDFCLISPSTVLIRRDLFLEHQGFNESFKVCEDYDLWLKILSREEVGFISTPMTIKYGGHQDQLSTQFVAMDYWRIKSLVDLYQGQHLSKEIKNQIKAVVVQKSEILLKGYLKHQNLKAHDEILGLLIQNQFIYP